MLNFHNTFNEISVETTGSDVVKPYSDRLTWDNMATLGEQDIL